jgi:hypothetical protein
VTDSAQLAQAVEDKSETTVMFRLMAVDTSAAKVRMAGQVNGSHAHEAHPSQLGFFTG